jgi:hypothetical protein
MVTEKIKHLEFIQGVVNRLSQNSFLLKGWSVVLVSAFLAVSASALISKVAVFAFVPALIFWGLDAYYLRQERLFRGLYDAVRLSSNPPDFSMSTEGVKINSTNWLNVILSGTLLAFHGIITLLAILIGLMVTFRGYA